MNIRHAKNISLLLECKKTDYETALLAASASDENILCPGDSIAWGSYFASCSISLQNAVANHLEMCGVVAIVCILWPTFFFTEC